MNTNNFNSAANCIWLFLSILTMKIDKQIEVIGGLPKYKESTYEQRVDNGANYMLHIFDVRHVGWIDEFEPCPEFEIFLNIVRAMPLEQSYEDFVDGDEWKRMRQQALLVLNEAGLSACEIPPGKIRFSEYTEILLANGGVLDD